MVNLSNQEWKIFYIAVFKKYQKEFKNIGWKKENSDEINLTVLLNISLIKVALPKSGYSIGAGSKEAIEWWRIILVDSLDK